MKSIVRLLILPAVLATAVVTLKAQTGTAMVAQAILTEDHDAYVAAIAKINAEIKAKTGMEGLRHVYVGDFADDESHLIVVVSRFASVAAIAGFDAKLRDDPEMKKMLGDLKAIRKLGPSWLYKAVRDEGFYDGGAVLVTDIATADEDAYAKSLDGLKAIMDGNNFKDAKISLWRIVAGRREATHLVVVSLPSQARLAEMLDALSDKELLKTWNVGASKIRKSLRNGTYHEITK